MSGEPPTPEQLRRARKALRLTQAECAERVGISLSSYANYEQGRSRPKAAIIRKALWTVVGWAPRAKGVR